VFAGERQDILGQFVALGASLEFAHNKTNYFIIKFNWWQIRAGKYLLNRCHRAAS
jgi:hypothetical protein